VSVLLKGKPDMAIEALLQALRPAPRGQAAAPVAVVESPAGDNLEQALLSFVAGGPIGRTLSELKKHLDIMY
jgi:hypothetical protein